MLEAWRRFTKMHMSTFAKAFYALFPEATM
jgi:hypothetical protein